MCGYPLNEFPIDSIESLENELVARERAMWIQISVERPFQQILRRLVTMGFRARLPSCPPVHRLHYKRETHEPGGQRLEPIAY